MKICFKRSLLLLLTLMASFSNATTAADRTTLRDIYAEGSISDGAVIEGRAAPTNNSASIARSGVAGSSVPGGRIITTRDTSVAPRAGIISIMGTIGKALFDTSAHSGFSEHNLAKYLLVNIFAGITHALGGAQTGVSGLIALMFRIFNLGVLSITTLLVIYASVFSISTTSHDGGALGSGRFSPFSFARVLGSIVSLIPNFSGYSLVQVVVMKVIVAGVVVADLAWDATIDFVRFNDSNIFKNAPSSSTQEPVNYGGKLLFDTDIISNVGSPAVPAPTPANIHYSLGGDINSTTDQNIEKYLNPINMAIMDSVYIMRKCLPVMNGVMGSDVNPVFIVSQTSTNTGAIKIKDTIRVDLQMARSAGVGSTRVHCFDIELNYPSTVSPSTADTVINNQFISALKNYIKLGGDRVLTRHRLTGASLYTDAEVIRIFASELNDFYTQIKMSPGLVSIASAAHRQAIASGANTFQAAAASTTAQLAAANHNTVIAGKKQILAGFKKQGWASAGMHYTDLLGIDAAVSAQLNSVDRFIPILADRTSKLINYSYIFNSAVLKPLLLDVTHYQGSVSTLKMREHIKAKFIELFVQQAAPIVNSGVIGWAYNKTSAVRALVASPTFAANTDRFSMGPIVIQADIVPNEIKHMSAGVTNAILDAMSVDGPIRIPPNQFVEHKANPIKLTQSLGIKILSYSKNYFKNTTSRLYEEVTRAQQSAYGLSIVFSVMQGAAKAFVAYSKAKAVNTPGISKRDKARLSGGGIKANAIEGMTGLITDPVTQLIEFSNSIAKAIIGVYLPIGNGLAIVYFVAGLILGVYIPFLPTLIFIFAVLAWLFSVIEAMVAAPIVMTGFAHPEGHEIIGKADQAIMLLIGVFVRPFLTLIGFVMAMMISITVLQLFNQMILLSTVFYFRNLTQPGIANAIPVMFGVSGLTVLYSYALMVLLQQSYSMIYLIPDQILKWVGGPAQSAGAGIASVMRSVSSGLSQQSQSAAQGASSSSRGSTSVSTSQ